MEEDITGTRYAQLYIRIIKILKLGKLTLEKSFNNQPESESFENKVIDYSIGFVESLPMSQLRESENPIRSRDLNVLPLAQSIKEKGLLQPILVRPKEDYFEIVAGNRRFNACKLLGWRKIQCHIVELNDKDAFEISLIENIQRETMDPLEEAEAYKKYVAEFGWGSISELAKRIGKSASYISKRISILELPIDVLEKIKSMEIRPSVAEELLRTDKRETQSELAQLVSTRHLSMRQVRKIINDTSRDDSNIHYRSTCPSGLNRAERGYDKAITSLRLTLIKLAGVMEDLEEHWIVYQMLLEHKNAIHSQIDLLMKEKRTLVHLRMYK